MSNLAVWQLRGPVRAVRHEWCERDLAADCWKPALRSTLTEFRADGQLSLTESRNPDGSVFRSTNTYNDAGLLVQSDGRTGEVSSGRAFQYYDVDGRPIRSTRQDPEEVERTIEEWTYVSDGGKTHIFHIPKMQSCSDIYCPIEGVDLYFGAPGAATIVTVFDSRNLAVEARVQAADGGLLRRVALSRDDSGQLARVELMLGDQPLVPDLPAFGAGIALMTLTYSYDERGRRRERVQKMMGLQEEREVFRYDDHDNVVETTTDSLQCEATVDDDGNVHYREGTLHRRQTSFTYVYDAHGNWTEKSTATRQATNPDFTPCMSERREIAYW